MAAFAPAQQIRGRIAAYHAGTIPEIDAHLTKLTASWAKLQAQTPPTDKMRGDYQADVDLLLEARSRLTRVVSSTAGSRKG